ncbi:MAG: hypothetical protein H7338_01275 [Candidatus Sericytochromatia bacterium]|nr:hypothetical protein [Candidatus Sericytochromatia bacterium]
MADTALTAAPSLFLEGSSPMALWINRRFGLRFNAQTPHVRVILGEVSAALPGRVNLPLAQTPVRDQGAVGSCTGFAMAGLAEYTAKHRSGAPGPGFICML